MLLKHLPYHSVTMRLDVPQIPAASALPHGYRIVPYTSDLLPGWVDLQVGVDHIKNPGEARALFEKEFLSDPAMAAQRCLFALAPDGTVAGFTALWQGDTFGVPMARIHWVAVAQAHQGKGLAKALMAACLRLYGELGLTGGLYLTSQTWSAKALRIYAAFGFTPCNRDGSVPLTCEDARAWAIIEEEWAAYTARK